MIKKNEKQRNQEYESKLVRLFWDCLSDFNVRGSSVDVTADALWVDLTDTLGRFVDRILPPGVWEKRTIAYLWPYDVSLSENNTFCIVGGAASGMKSMYEYTDPFYFEMELGQIENKFVAYTLLIGDKNKISLPYRHFYKYADWYPSQREWKYEITKKSRPGDSLQHERLDD